MREIGSNFHYHFYTWTVMGYIYYSGNDLFYVCVRDCDGYQEDIRLGEVDED